MPGTVQTRAYLETAIAPNGTGSISGGDVQDFVASSLFDMGLWSNATTYVINDLVHDSSGSLWRSLTNPNLNHTPVAGANWAAMATIPAALPPNGSASGDLSGSYPSPTVAKVNGATLGTTTATGGNLLVGSGTAWVSVAVSGDATLASTGALTLANTAVTPGSYTGTSLTVDAKGRITAASSVSYLTGNQTVTLSGDATGSGATAITTVVAKINGATLGTTTATAGNLLIGSGTAWVTNAITGVITLSSSGVTAFASTTGSGAVVLATSPTLVTPALGTPASGVLSGCTGYPQPYVMAQEQIANNTDGGTFTSGSWQTRAINTIVNDSASIASISSNQITLPAGTYTFRAAALALEVNGHQIRVYNVTDSAVIAYGTAQYALTTSQVSSESSVAGQFTIAGSKAIRLEHRCGSTKTSFGFGAGANFGNINVFSWIEFTKIV